MLDLADTLAGQYFNRRVRKIGPDQRHRFIDGLLRMRRQSIVQRQRITLVLQQDSRAELGDRREAALQFLVHRWRIGDNGFSTDAHFRAMAAHGRKFFRRENQVDVVERTAADQCQRAGGSLQQPVQGP